MSILGLAFIRPATQGSSVAKKKKASGGAKRPTPRKDLVRNRKARYEFEILEDFEAGVSLKGTEVKSIRAGNVSISESFVRLEGEEAFWVGGNVDEYPWGHSSQHEPKRKRKLLLRKSQLRKLRESVRQKGLTVVPLALYLTERGFIKLEIAIARGKKTRDKRESEKKRQATRDLRRELA